MAFLNQIINNDQKIQLYKFAGEGFVRLPDDYHNDNAVKVCFLDLETTGLNKDVIPFMLIGGRPAKHYRLNSVGLRRAGITGARYKVLSSAFRLLRNKQPLDELEQTEELAYLQQWLAAESKRGIHSFVELS